MISNNEQSRKCPRNCYVGRNLVCSHSYPYRISLGSVGSGKASGDSKHACVESVRVVSFIPGGVWVVEYEKLTAYPASCTTLDDTYISVRRYVWRTRRERLESFGCETEDRAMRLTRKGTYPLLNLLNLAPIRSL